MQPESRGARNAAPDHPCPRFHPSPTGPADPESAWLSLLRHELKTPLVGLLALAGRLDETLPEPGQRAVLEALVACARQLHGLVDRLVPARDTTGSGTPGTTPDEPPGTAAAGCRGEPVDGHRLLEHVVLAHWPRARAQGLRLHLCIAPGVPRRWLVEPGRLREILDNLLVNALNATSRGHVLVRAVVAEPLGGRCAVTLGVEDTGRGIDGAGPPLYRWGIRGDSVIDGADRGSGIGLFVCRWLAGELGGRIAHEPRPGGGTAFRLTIPVATGSEPLPAAAIRPSVFGELRCAVALPEPAGEAAVSLLRRIGIRARRIPGAGSKLAPDRREAVLCDPQRTILPAGALAGHPEPAPFALVLDGPGRKPGAEPGAYALPEPALRCTWEAVLLEAVMRRLSGAPGSAP